MRGNPVSIPGGLSAPVPAQRPLWLPVLNTVELWYVTELSFSASLSSSPSGLSPSSASVSHQVVLETGSCKWVALFIISLLPWLLCCMPGGPRAKDAGGLGPWDRGPCVVPYLELPLEKILGDFVRLFRQAPIS